MDISKQKKFNTKMGKRKKMSHGGMIRHPGRKNFDTGGIANNTIAPTTGTNNSVVTQGGNALNNAGIANAVGLGNNFQAGSANIQSGTNAQQLGSAYTGANNAINAQVGLTNTLTPQATGAVENQNALAAQELAMTQGGGPNPALEQLAQQTNTNVNNTAALMAGQRGGAANPALLARQAAQQGANTQQEAVGQAATLQAQQQIAAQQNLAQLEANRISQTGQATENLNTQQQNEQNILQGANTAYNNAAVGMQSNVNNVNGQTAAGNQAANKGLLGSIASVIPGLGGFHLSHGGEVNEHLMLAEMNAHSLKHGKKYAEGGPVQSNLGHGVFNAPISAGNGLQDQGGPGNYGTAANNLANEEFGKQIQGLGTAASGAVTAYQDNQAEGALADEFAQEDAAAIGGGRGNQQMVMYKGGFMHPGPHDSHVANYLAAGGMSKKVPAMVSPGEIRLSAEEVREVVEKGANPLKLGKKYLGKPKVKGDSLKNDIIPEDLEDGDVILPRHITSKKDPDKAELFVRRAVHMKNPKKAAGDK